MDRKSPLNGGTFPLIDGNDTTEGPQPSALQWNADVQEICNVVEGSGQVLDELSGSPIGADGKSWKETISNQQLMISLLSLKLGEEFRTDPIGNQKVSFFDLAKTQRSESFLRTYACEYVDESEGATTLEGQFGRLEFSKESYPNFHRIMNSWSNNTSMSSLRIFYNATKDASENQELFGGDANGARISLRFKVDNYFVKTGTIYPVMSKIALTQDKYFNEVITETKTSRIVTGESNSSKDALRTMIPTEKKNIVRNVMSEGTDYNSNDTTRIFNPAGTKVAGSANLITDESRITAVSEKLFVKVNWQAYVDTVEFAMQLGLIDLSTNKDTGAYNNLADVELVKNGTLPLWTAIVSATRKRLNLSNDIEL